MSEWTAEDVLRDSRRLRDGQPIGDTTLACLVDRICKYCDSFAARLEADAQPVDECLRCRDLADEAAMAAKFRFDGAVADIARLTARVKELEAELSAIRKPFGLDMNTWCSLCEGNLASPRELTCIRGGLLKLYYNRRN